MADDESGGGEASTTVGLAFIYDDTIRRDGVRVVGVWVDAPGGETAEDVARTINDALAVAGVTTLQAHAG